MMRFHYVRPGDTIKTIALQYYGSTQAWTHIFHANRDVITSSLRLSPGMKVLVPTMPLHHLTDVHES